MHYFGIPTCPYCKKRVNIIRVWSMKRHGEFMCPRCKGISNIHLSPLVYVFAVLAVAAGFLIYFFSKFVLDNVSLMTPVQVLIPFAVFFIFSLFFVYLEKPVIKKVRKTTDGKYYDENGNEMKMKMGKMVYSSEQSDTSFNTSNQNRYNDTHQSGNFTLNNTAHAASASRGATPRYKNTSFDNSVELEDNEDIYSSLESKKSPVSRAAVERPAAPAQGRAQYRAAPERPVSAEVQRRQPKAVEDIPVGSVAKERVNGSTPNSGFEDLFQTYSPSRKQPAPRATQQPAQRTRQQAPDSSRRYEEAENKKKSGGTRFRDL